MELGAVHDASPSPPPKVVDIGLGLEGMTAIGRRGGHLGPQHGCCCRPGEQTGCLLDACATVRDIHESWREGPHGVGIEAVPPGKNPSVGKRSTLAGRRWGERDGSIDLVSWARQRHRRSARGEDVPCASHGRELRRISSRCDRSRLSSRSCSQTDTHLGIAGTAPVHVRPTRSGLRDSAATEGSVHGYSRLAVPIPHRPSQTRPYAVAGFPFVRLFPAAARPWSPGTCQTSLAWHWH